MTSPEGVGIRRIVSSCLVSRLTSLYGLLTGMHSMTPGRDSRMPRSMAPLFPVMPMAGLGGAAPGDGPPPGTAMTATPPGPPPPPPTPTPTTDAPTPPTTMLRHGEVPHTLT